MIKNDVPKFSQFKGQHNKFTSVCFEDIIIGERYAFTFNPAYQYPLKQPAKCLWKLYEKLTDICHGYELECYPETSKSGRLHLHGYIVITDIVKWMSGVQGLQILGTVCIKRLFNAEEDTDGRWDAYCIKQRRIWGAISAEHKLPYPYLISNKDFVPGSKLNK